MKRYIVDRIEAEYAVCECEDLSLVNIPLGKFPRVKEGDCLVFDGENYFLDGDERDRRKKRIDKLMDELFD